MLDVIKRKIEKHILVANRMFDKAGTIEEIVQVACKQLASGKKLLFAGNGGSAADAQHWVAELVVRLSPKVKRRGIPAIALTTDSSILTACGNDFGYDEIFQRQVESLGQEGDLLFCISTSGNSNNLIAASKTARKLGLQTIGVLGKDGGKLVDRCDYSFIAPSMNTQRIQEMHVIFGHLLCELIEVTLIEEHEEMFKPIVLDED